MSRHGSHGHLRLEYIVSKIIIRRREVGEREIPYLVFVKVFVSPARRAGRDESKSVPALFALTVSASISVSSFDGRRVLVGILHQGNQSYVCATAAEAFQGVKPE